jgi:hypothetical protein
MASIVVRFEWDYDRKTIWVSAKIILILDLQ